MKLQKTSSLSKSTQLVCRGTVAYTGQSGFSPVVMQRRNGPEAISVFLEVGVELCYYSRADREQVSSVFVKHLKARIISFSGNRVKFYTSLFRLKLNAWIVSPLTHH